MNCTRPAGPLRERLRRQPGHRGVVARHVDDRVRLPAVERGQVLGPVPDNGLDAGIETGVGLPSVEQRDGVPASQRGIDYGTAGEPGPAEDENAHGPMVIRSRRPARRWPDEPALIVPWRLRLNGAELSLFTTLTTFGTPRDITPAELAVELFYPADERTAAALRLDGGSRRVSPVAAG
jgi:hypothetical protein